MTKALAPQPRKVNQKKTIYLVVSKYHEEFTKGLLQNALQELEPIAEELRIEVVHVPGAFEIPVATETIMREKTPNCVICLGLLIKGQTAHAKMVAMSVMNALQSIAVNHATPVVNEVLLVSNEKEAYARCLGKVINRGREAAQNALAFLDSEGAYIKTLRPPIVFNAKKT